MNTVTNFDDCLDQRDQLIDKYLPMAEKLAIQRDHTTPSNIALDDLRSVAFLALVDAAHKYNGNPHTFKAYAAIRIRGDMIDYIRSMCWGTRGNYSGIVSLDQEVNDEGFTLASMIEDHRSPEPTNYRDAIPMIDSLDELGQQVISRYYVENKTQLEIANELGISRTNVGRLLDRYKESVAHQQAEDALVA